MKNLETLIQELCTDGVEFVKLGDVCKIKRGIRVVKKDLQETGKNPVYQNSLVPLGYKDEFNYPSNVAFVISAGAAGDVGYSEVPFWAADDCLTITCPSNIENKYVYYFLKNYEYKLKSKVRKASIPRLSRKVVDDLEIPLPPIEVQTEIVRILDKFTSLEAELEAELKAELDCRKRQYEYYRDKLLSFDNVGGQEVEWKTLGELAEIGTGSSNTKDGLSEGLYPFYTRGQEVLRKNEYEFDDEAIITAGDGVGVGKVIHYVKGKYALHQRAYRFKPGDLLNARFLYFYMTSTFYKYVCGNSVSSSVSSLRKPRLLKYPIPLLPMQEQIRIVSILDRFESLTTSLQSGLPAEITARRQQYEHYRDKLLTFKRKGVA